MPESDLDLLITAARAAGKVAQAHQGGDLQIREKDDGAGPVTAADLAVNELLEDQLRAARPGYGWLSEESADPGIRRDHDTVFIIDPIDGTRSFIEGARSWAHALAVVRHGEVTAAVVYLPMLDRLYAAQRGAGATLNGAPIRAGARADLNGAEILAARPALEPRHWPGGLPDVTRVHRPSLAYRLSLVAEGRYDAMLTLRPSWEWDIAAGSLLLEEAGAKVTDRQGGALRFNNPTPQSNGVLAANGPLHAALLKRLT